MNTVTNVALFTLAAVEFDLADVYVTYFDGAIQAVEDVLMDIISKERKVRANSQQTKSVCLRLGLLSLVLQMQK